MLGWILQIAIISFIFIYLVHHLITFLTSTLTVPKIKDLVNSPIKKYENIFNTIEHTNNCSYINNNSYTNIDLLPVTTTEADNNSMKDELKNFLKKQLNNDTPQDKNYNVIAYDSYQESLSSLIN